MPMGLTIRGGGTIGGSSSSGGYVSLPNIPYIGSSTLWPEYPPRNQDTPNADSSGPIVGTFELGHAIT